jgi:hypothetical protein
MNTTQSSMKSPDEPVPDAASPDQGGARWSWPARLALMFTGVLLPILYFGICFAIGPLGREWRSENFDAHACLLLFSHKPSLPFYPFLLYSMTCMTLLAFGPGRFVKTFVVRFGVYTGVLLAVQYWLIFVCTFAGGDNPLPLAFVELFSFGVVAIPWTVGWLIVMLSRKSRLFGKFAAVLAAVLAGLYGLCLVGTVVLSGDLSRDPGGVGRALFRGCLGPSFVGLCCATPWAVASYSAMAIYAARHSRVKRLQFSLAQLLGVVTWLAAFLGAWRISVLWLLQAYDKLPTGPPPGRGGGLLW